jgi:transposase-like protein
MDVKCPACASPEVIKYGTTQAEKQKYKCVSCRRQFVSGSEHLIKPEIREQVQRLILADIHPKKIFQIINMSIPEKGQPKISLRSIYKLTRKAKNDRQEKD